MHRRAFLLSTTGIVAATAGCGGAGDAQGDDEFADLPGEATIEIVDGSFDPRKVHVATGATVTWENGSEESHRVDAFQFHTGSEAWSYAETLEPDESTSYTFEEEGRYDFTDQGYGQFTMCGRVRVGSVEEGESLPCE